MPHTPQEKSEILTFLVNEINKNLKLEIEKLELEADFQQENLQETEKRLTQKSQNNKHLNHLINQQIIFHKKFRQQVQQEKENLQTKSDNLKHQLEQAGETSQHKLQK